MSETKHTPGPEKWLTIYTAQNERIAFIEDQKGSVKPSQHVDKVEYIPLDVAAAAPELLTKLKDLYGRIHQFSMDAELMPGDLAVLQEWKNEIKHTIRNL